MKKTLFCFDVDDTLRERNCNGVALSTILALSKLKKAGHVIAINTGRSLDSLKHTNVIKCADWDGFILNNGQTILNENLDIIDGPHTISPEIVKKAIAIANEQGQPVKLKMDQFILTAPANEYVYSTSRYFNNFIPEVDIYDENLPVYAMILYGPKGYDYAPYKEIQGLYVAPGRDCYADATIDGITKGTSGKKLAQYLGLKGYIAFGDSQNDFEMFKEADFRICMGDGDPATQSLADYVTTGIKEDGIYNACLNLGYFKRIDDD